MWHYKEVSEKQLSRLVIFDSDHHSCLSQMIYNMAPKGMGKSPLSQIHTGCQILGSGVCRMHLVSLQPARIKSHWGCNYSDPTFSFFPTSPWIIPNNQDRCNWSYGHDLHKCFSDLQTHLFTFSFASSQRVEDKKRWTRRRNRSSQSPHQHISLWCCESLEIES